MHTSYQEMHLSYIDNTQNTALANSNNPYTQDISRHKCKAKVVVLS